MSKLHKNFFNGVRGEGGIFRGLFFLGRKFLGGNFHWGTFPRRIFPGGIFLRNGYNIVRNYRNRNGGCVACYIRNNICFNRKACISDNKENIFIDLLFLKTKPISVGIIYKPPSQTQFLEQMITEFETLDLHNEIYVLGDFNINLLFRGKYVLNKPNETKKIDKYLLPEIKRYKELCSMYGLSQ